MIILAALLIFSLSYSFLALAIAWGTPPLYFGYERTEERRQEFEKSRTAIWHRVFPWLFGGVLVLMAGSILEWPPIFLLPSIGCNLIAGFKLRRWVKDTAEMPYPLIDFFFPRRFRYEGVFRRWPMLVFDIWTIGLSSAICLSVMA